MDMANNVFIYFLFFDYIQGTTNAFLKAFEKSK